MDDLISRAAAVAQIKENYCDWCDHTDLCQSCETRDCIATIEQQVPAVDAVPVVHCRDCKHRPTDNRGRDDDSTGFAIEFPDSRCPCQCEDGWYNWYPNDDWFCADGKRRDDECQG